MRSKTNKNLRAVLPAVAAAGLSAWLGAPAAHASFNLAFVKGATSGGYTVWTLTAQNDGTAGAQQQPQGFLTGTGLIALDLILDTPGSFSSTTGAMFIDLNADIDGDGASDANVDGAADETNGTTQPSFGSALGTFIGFNSASPTNKHTNTTPLEGNSVYVNSQTYTQFTQAAVGGGTTSAQGTPAIYETSQTPDNETSELDPAFVNGTVHSLELIIQASQNDTVAHAIANFVIPSNVVGTATALITPTASPSNTETYTLFTIGTPPPSTLSIALTSSSTNTAAAAPITLVGSNGGYQAVEISVASGAQTKGELTVTNFNPASDKEIYVLEANSNGTPLTSAQLTQIITDLQAALTPANGSVGLFSSLPATIQALFHGTYNLEVTLPTGNAPTAGAATNPDELAYDFSQYTTIPGVTITAIGVVPEPTGVGVLVLGGIGLMARRRRMAKASA
jgi:hypothetical protein